MASVPDVALFPAHHERRPGDSLPPDVLSQAARRVRIAALVFVALWAIVLVMNAVVARIPGMRGDGSRGPWTAEEIAYAIAGLLLFLALAAAASRLRAHPHLVIDLGLGGMVVSALLVGVLTNLNPSFSGARVSWIVVVILLYPAIAPVTPRKMLIAALIAASMDPLGLTIAHLRGADTSEITRDAFSILWFFLPTYLAAIAATVPAQVIHGLGRQVTRERELGSYKLGELLGRGGMGEVYRATHRMLARPAAIKMIRREALGELPADAARGLVERFRREAEAVASLTSVHTVTLYDFGVSDDGTFFHVMELLDGFNVQELVERYGPLPPERAIQLLIQTCEALGEAHARGLVHRDIKPSNIFVCRRGTAYDFVKVLDFGLVTTHAARREPSSASLSMPGVPIGTPGYMAPEMVVGEEGVDHRADVYALGCVAYWMLAGRPVFTANTSIAQLVQHVQQTPEPPSRFALHAIPRELDCVVLDCLAKDPADRPHDVTILARRLAACPVPAWGAARAEAWWRALQPSSST